MSFLSDVKWAPLRPIDDFLTSSARFKVPNYTNLERWSNRVVQNFLYYQTNYFVITAVIYALFIFINPSKTMLGLFVLNLTLLAGLKNTPMDFLFSKFQLTQSDWSIDGIN